MFQKHFTKLYNQVEGTAYDPEVLNEITCIETDQELGNQPSEREIRNAVKKMRFEKSPGPNGIPTEAYKCLEGEGFKILQKIILKVWNNHEYVPEEWRKITLSVLPKTGDLSNPNKWRGIA